MACAIQSSESVKTYGLLTSPKREVKMAGYWPSSFFFACLCTETESRSINLQNKKERGQYPAILTEEAWSIKDLLFGFLENVSRGTRRVIPSGQENNKKFENLKKVRLFYNLLEKMETGSIY